MNFGHIVTELLWFLRGDTNVKYLIDNGCNIWNGDAYNYYCKKCKEQSLFNISFDSFEKALKNNEKIENLESVHGGVIKDYQLGNCGWQYGKLWRNWDYIGEPKSMESDELYPKQSIDQITELINGLKSTPEGRRHMITALNPAHYNDLALFPCHVLAQFNCRPLTIEELEQKLSSEDYQNLINCKNQTEVNLYLDTINIPKYYLDCQTYQRSADVFLGVPYNIASYALLTHVLCEICNFGIGEIICTYGDVHIYENHKEPVDIQLERTPTTLPRLEISKCPNVDWKTSTLEEILSSINSFEAKTFILKGYSPQAFIKGELSTGM